MKFLLRFLLFAFAAIIGITRSEEAPTPVRSQGESLIATASGRQIVRVRINTHEMDIGKPSDERPAVIQSNCTYSKYPCSIVDSVEISVNGKPLFTPRSVFCDLADLGNAELKAVGKEKFLLTLYGGDASEVYIVKIWFNEAAVSRRTMSSGLSPRQVLQETNYHTVVLGD